MSDTRTRIATMVVDETPLPVHAIEFAEGHMIFHATWDGAQAVDASAEVSVYAPDGSLVIHTPRHSNRNHVWRPNGSRTCVEWRTKLVP